MALYRLGYTPPEEKRNRIDWTSRQRKRASQYVFRNTCATRVCEFSACDCGRMANHGHCGALG